MYLKVKLILLSAFWNLRPLNLLCEVTIYVTLYLHGLFLVLEELIIFLIFPILYYKLRCWSFKLVSGRIDASQRFYKYLATILWFISCSQQIRSLSDTLKGTVSVILVFLCPKNCIARFTTIPLKAWFDLWTRSLYLCLFKLNIIFLCFSVKVTCAFFVY